MQQQLIIDKDGEWFVNTAQFPFVDPTNGVRFDPRVLVKVKVTDWMKGQPTLQTAKAEESKAEVKAAIPVKAEDSKAEVKAAISVKATK